jgi:pyruvate kinase
MRRSRNAKVVATRREQFAQAGQTLVAIAGMPFGAAGTTNLMRIATA